MHTSSFSPHSFHGHGLISHRSPLALPRPRLARPARATAETKPEVCCYVVLETAQSYNGWTVLCVFNLSLTNLHCVAHCRRRQALRPAASVPPAASLWQTLLEGKMVMLSSEHSSNSIDVLRLQPGKFHRCDQKGRVAGGLGAVAEWWPIKVGVKVQAASSCFERGCTWMQVS